MIASPAVAANRGDAPPTIEAVIHGTTAYFVEADKLQRLDLATGEKQRLAVPGFSNPLRRRPQPGPGDIANAQAIMRRLAAANGARNFVAVPQGVDSQSVAGGPRIDPQLSIADGVLYPRVVESQWSARMRQAAFPSREELIAVRLDADKATFDEEGLEAVEPVRFQPPSVDSAAEGQTPAPRAVGYQFASTPTVVGDRLYVALARPGTRTEIAAACYATGGGRLLWKTNLGSGDSSQGMFGVTAAPPVAAGDTLYLATNLGAIAALDSSTGRLRWLARYPREGQPMMRYDAAPPQQATKCVVVGDQVIAAPSDSTRLFAWDTATGALLWDADRPRDASLVGVVRSNEGSVAVLSGWQLASYDTLTGQRRMLWPESPRSGLRGLGEAAIVGDEVFWPTREAIFAIDPLTGGLTRSPIDLSPVGAAGANVFATDYGLLVCGPERLRLLARVEAVGPPEPLEPLSRLRETDSAGLAHRERPLKKPPMDTD